MARRPGARNPQRGRGDKFSQPKRESAAPGLPARRSF